MKNSDVIAFGPVHLDIRDLDQSVAFWRNLVGLDGTERNEDSATLGVDGLPLVILHASATQPLAGGYSGLYHLAIHLPSELELARALARVRASGRRFGASDHIVAESVYLNDPDGIGLEIAFETPQRVCSYRWDKGAERPLVIDSARSWSSGSDSGSRAAEAET
jgi:catechol 2,3-dioxygenase